MTEGTSDGRSYSPALILLEVVVADVVALLAAVGVGCRCTLGLRWCGGMYSSITIASVTLDRGVGAAAEDVAAIGWDDTVGRDGIADDVAALLLLLILGSLVAVGNDAVVAGAAFCGARCGAGCVGGVGAMRGALGSRWAPHIAQLDTAGTLMYVHAVHCHGWEGVKDAVVAVNDCAADAGLGVSQTSHTVRASLFS